MPSDVDFLLDRPYPPEYENDWLQFVKNSEIEPKSLYLRVLVFRIHEDFLALESHTLKAVTERKVLHKIPFSKQPIKGVVNFKGDLKPVVSLNYLITGKPCLAETESGFMVLISQEDDDWVFIVDEILGIFDISPNDLQNVPVNISKSFGSLIKGIIKLNEKTVAIIEEELLFYALKNPGFHGN